ncbi:MAG: outer membrane beta-barrel protein [Bacteroidota bacterium]
MKRSIYYCLLLAFCSVYQLNAQMSLGVKGGYTKAWEDYGDVELPEDAEIHVEGFNVSLTAFWKFNRYLSVGVEPGFVQRGAACVPGWMPIFEGDTKFFLNYVEMPLMAMGHLPLFGDRLELFAKGGYGLSYLASATREETIFNGENPQVTRTKMELGGENSILNRWDQGIYTGLGVACKIGPGQVTLEGNYFHGLKDADKTNTSENRSISWNIGYRINL